MAGTRMTGDSMRRPKGDGGARRRVVAAQAGGMGNTGFAVANVCGKITWMSLPSTWVLTGAAPWFWPLANQVRQRPKPGRCTGQHPGARQRHPSDLSADVRHGKAGIPHATGLSGHKTAARRRRRPFGRRMLSPVILVPAILNGLLTGAVYGLIALGLTLIYGVLHIINFAHGALLTAAMFAAFFAHRLL